MNCQELQNKIKQNWNNQLDSAYNPALSAIEIYCTNSLLVEICRDLFLEWNFNFAGLVVEQSDNGWLLRYCFYENDGNGWIHVLLNVSEDNPNVPSIVEFVCAADWHEREMEDFFGLFFEGHPRLGNFVLHDEVWIENVRPMHHNFNSQVSKDFKKSNNEVRPQKLLQEDGSFIFPVGPKFSGITEPAHFLLETVGEDVIRANPRLFFKWRAIEKIAEGKNVNYVLELAERFSATTAFAHGLTYCLAVEAISHAKIPLRAEFLRIFLAELERLRHHMGAIQEICESTALAVANSQMAILEEDLLRISAVLTRHRYLFGLLIPGGLLCDLSDEACKQCLSQSKEIIHKLQDIEKKLSLSSSFLDRLEEVGILTYKNAKNYGVLGPVARASGISCDLRRVQPYSGYQNFNFEVPIEQEGDGYARLRVLFAEAKQSFRIMEQVIKMMPGGDVYIPVQPNAGAFLSWVEAPRGGSFQWLRLSNDGHVLRYRSIPPSFANWHGFHLAVENFAFQDFPIILSTFDLSIAENDR